MSRLHGEPQPLLAGVVRRALALDGADAFPSRPLGPGEWRRLVRDAEAHRLSGMLTDVIAEGSLPVTDDQLAEAVEESGRWAAHVVEVEDLALRAVDALRDAGVDVRVAKGVALARVAYDDPSLRVFADADLLVPSPSVGTAVDVLHRTLDARRVLPELRPGFDVEFAKEVLLRLEGGWELDLHRTLVPGPFGLTVPLPELYRDRPTFKLAGRDVPTLSVLHHGLHAAMSAALSDLPVRYSALADFVMVVERTGTDHAELVATARRWGQAAVVQRAVELVVSHIGVWQSHPLRVWADSYEPSRRERLLLGANLAPGRTYLRQLAAVAVLDGVGARWRYVSALAAPSPEYLRARGWDRRSHARRGLRRLRRGR